MLRLILIAMLCADPRGDARGRDESTALALLRGVENSRLMSSAGRIRCKVVATVPPGESQSSTVIFEFQDARRRVSTTAAVSTVDGGVAFDRPKHQEVTGRCIFDGDSLYEYDGIASAVRVVPAQAPPAWAFDPRILGITVLYRPEVSLGQCMAYSSGKDIKFVGVEELDGNAVAHISLVDQYDQRVQFWIEPNGAFRVRRVQLDVAGFTYTTNSRFEKDLSFSWLPTGIDTTYRGPEGQVRQQWKVDEIEAESDVVFEPGIFSLAGLDMPHGTPVADLARKVRMGYWDGKRLTDDPSGARAEIRPLAPSESRRGRALLISNFVAFAVVLAVIAWRLWQRRGRSE